MTGSKYNSYRPERLSLSAKEWLVTIVICLTVMQAVLLIWQRFVLKAPGTDFRIPYVLSQDYWLFEQICQKTSYKQDWLLIGDSVIWGHYVPKDQTLSHYLNEQRGTESVANLGLDGAHPLALEGLLRYYGKAIRHKNVILHFNPLWISSLKHDLQTTKEFHFNHPDLVPQFWPKIPCYQASWETRFSRVIRQHVSFINWVSHLNLMYYDGMSLPVWTTIYPKDNPFLLLLATEADTDYYEQSSGTTTAPASLTLDWVSIESSLQWRAFTRTIQLLQRRDNRIRVLVGPFNEHLLTEQNLIRYNRLKHNIDIWLHQNGITHLILEPLPAEVCLDASHPTAKGYEMLAEQINKRQAFK